MRLWKLKDVTMMDQFKAKAMSELTSKDVNEMLEEISKINKNAGQGLLGKRSGTGPPPPTHTHIHKEKKHGGKRMKCKKR